VNILNQPTRGGPPAWGLCEGLTNPHHKKSACYEMLHRAMELNKQALVNAVMNLQVPLEAGNF
jgi:hypothetical protein